MKRLPALFVLLCLLSSAIGLAQDDKKLPEIIPGWEVYGGKWTDERGGVRSNPSGASWLQWKGEAKKSIDLQFCVAVRAPADPGPHHLAVSWNADATGQVRNILYIAPNGLNVSVYPANDAGPAATASVSLQYGKRLPVRMQITPEGVQALVGGEKIKASIPSSSLTMLRLYVHHMDAVFTKIKVKSK